MNRRATARDPHAAAREADALHDGDALSRRLGALLRRRVLLWGVTLALLLLLGGVFGATLWQVRIRNIYDTAAPNVSLVATAARRDALTVSVPSDPLGLVRPGEPAEVRIDGRDVADARVTRVERRNGRLLITVRVAGRADAFAPGIASVQLTVRHHRLITAFRR